jgi:enoyl-CoA hydratase/carnithine racemase
MPEVQFTHTDSVARIRFDRAEEANAVNYATMRGFIDALEAAHSSGCTVLVLSGAGADFTVGRDKGERVAGVSRSDNLKLILRANELLGEFPGISLAVIRGRALGFGTGLALHSDIALAADTAVLGFDELAAGLPPLVVLTYLYRHVLPKTADELVLTGRRVSATEALKLGLVSRVLPEADLDTVAERTVAELTGRDPSALRLLKEFAREAKSPAPRVDKEAGEYAVERLVAWIEGARA